MRGATAEAKTFAPRSGGKPAAASRRSLFPCITRRADSIPLTLLPLPILPNHFPFDPFAFRFLSFIGKRMVIRMNENEVIDSTELAKRLNVPETWIRSRTDSKRTSDPIPHLRFGRYVRFRWGSEELGKWVERQLVRANGQGH